MPFNGSGTFNRLYSWAVDAANNVNISSPRMDAELNGVAAALSNCITRDGQSPPSANLPMGGLKITNLGVATTATDALSQAAGDARYILASVTNLTLTGTLTAVTATISGNGTIGGTLGVTGLATLSGGANITGSVNATSGNIALLSNGTSFLWTDANGGHPSFGCDGSNNLALNGTDGSGAARTIFSVGMHNSSSVFTFNISAAGLTPTVGDNSTKFATTAFVVASFAPLASPTFTGTATTANLTATGTVTATGTLSTGTNANSIGYVGAPSNVKTANYTLAASDIGQDITFNGTTLTCTIPAGLPNGFVAIVANINSSPLTITSASDTLTQSGTTTTGNRTLGQNGEARVIRRNGVLYIGGTALS